MRPSGVEARLGNCIRSRMCRKSGAPEAPGNWVRELRLLLLRPGGSLATFAHAVERNHSVDNRCCNIYQYNFHRFAFLCSTN
jgi:hypothetical protein